MADPDQLEDHDATEPADPEYDQWFRERVHRAIDEADRPDAVWFSHAEVVEEMRRLVDRMEAEAKSRKLAGD